MAFQFDERTGLFLDLNKLNKTSEEIRDILKENLSDETKIVSKINSSNTQKIIKSNEKQNKVLSKDLKDYNNKLDKNLKKLSERQAERDKKGRFISTKNNEKSASDKVKELKDKNKKDDKQKVEVKIPAEEIGEAVGDAYYQSYHELKSLFTPFIDSTKSIFQFFSKTLFSKKDDKDVKNASQKTIKEKQQDTTNKKILDNSKKELATDEKILKELKHHRPKSGKSLFSLGGMLGILKKILLGLAPLGLMYGLLKKKLGFLNPKRYLSKNKKVSTKKTTSKTREVPKNRKNRDVLDREAKRSVKTREVPKSRTRIKIPEKLEKKAGLKVGAKIGGKVVSKFIPGLGAGLGAYDVFNTLHDMGQHKNITFTQAFKKNVLGMDVDYDPHLTKKQLVKIDETKKAVKNGKSVLTTPNENKYPSAAINGNTNWRDNDPTLNKKETKKNNIKKEIPQQQKVIPENVLEKAQLDTQIELVKMNLITNKLLEELITKVGGKTINYSPTKRSLNGQ